MQLLFCYLNYKKWKIAIKKWDCHTCYDIANKLHPGKDSWNHNQSADYKISNSERNTYIHKCHCNYKGAGGVTARHTFAFLVFTEYRCSSKFFVRSRSVKYLSEKSNYCKYCKRWQRNSCKNFNIGKKHKNNKNAIRYKHYKREKVIA